MLFNHEELRALAQQFADQVFRVHDDPEYGKRIPEFVEKLLSLIDAYDLLARWGGGNRFDCDMPNNPHGPEHGSYKICKNPIHKVSMVFCTAHHPLDHCPICGNPI
jgi:hypothetical protein